MSFDEYEWEAAGTGPLDMNKDSVVCLAFCFLSKTFLILEVLSAFYQSVEAGSRHNDYSGDCKVPQDWLFFSTR